MKKLILFAAAFVLLVTVGVTIFAVVKLTTPAKSSQEVSATVDTEAKSDVLHYAQANYPDYTAKYDAKKNLLTLEKTTSFSMQSAESIYTEATTYLMQAQIFALDIAEGCNEPDLVVALCYVSKDGEPMFSVASDGTVTKYWQ